MEQYIAAIEQRENDTKCTLFDHSGMAFTSVQESHHILAAQEGWIELDPMEIWQRTQDSLEGALKKGNLKSEQIAAIGIANQRGTTIIWDRVTGRPLHNAIGWEDHRAESICADLDRHGYSDPIRKRTGLPLADCFSAPKISWLLQNDPEVRKAAEHGTALFGTMDSWLVWNLTGGINGGLHITDVTNASHTLLMNLPTMQWDGEILTLMGIPRSMLPDIQPSSQIYGFSKGILAEVPVSGALGDQQAVLFGHTCFGLGEAKNSYGHGCSVLMNTGTRPVPSKNGLITCAGYKVGTQPVVYCLEGSIPVAGALVDWLKNNFGFIQNGSDLESLARSVENNGGVYFVPAFDGLSAPYWRENARGVITGLTRHANKGHLARAVIEATAYQTREILEAMVKDSGMRVTSLKVDGEMTGMEILMQFQADLLNVPAIRPVNKDIAGLGAAYAAGLAEGYWKSTDDLRANWKMDRQWNPAMNPEQRKNNISKWKKAVIKSFDWED